MIARILDLLDVMVSTPTALVVLVLVIGVVCGLLAFGAACLIGLCA